MKDDFNPFAKAAKNVKLREKTVSDYAEFLVTRAADMATEAETHKVFQSEENKQWLLDEIDELLDKDPWDESDVSRLSAMFFFLLTTSR